MATTNRSGKPVSTDFIADGQSAETLERLLIDAPMEAAVQSAFGTGRELGRFLQMLPEALIASERRELERVRAANGNPARAAALEASIEEIQSLQTLSQRGQVRVQRAFRNAASGELVFHGFVSDTNLAPLAGLTVRLADRATGRRELSATTDADGYFNIPLAAKDRETTTTTGTTTGTTGTTTGTTGTTTGTTGTTTGDPRKERGPDLSRLFSHFILGKRLKVTVDVHAQAAAAPAAAASTGNAPPPPVAAPVEILRNDTVVHRDTITLPGEDGHSVYREFFIRDKNSPRWETPKGTREGTPKDTAPAAAKTIRRKKQG
jgi:hypothetical protein